MSEIKVQMLSVSRNFSGLSLEVYLQIIYINYIYTARKQV